MAVIGEDKDMFPLIEPERIVSGIAMMLPGMAKVTLEDLKAPQAQKMEILYRNLVVKILGLEGADLYQPHFSGMEVVKFVEIQQGSIGLLNLFLVLEKVLLLACCEDVVVKDISAPTPKRTLRILSALLNFANFHQGRLEEANNIFMKAASELDRKEQLSIKKEQLTKKIMELRQKKEGQKAALVQLKDENSNLSNRVVAVKSANEQTESILKNWTVFQDEGNCRLGLIKSKTEVEALIARNRILKEKEQKYLTQRAAMKQLSMDSNIAINAVTRIKTGIDEEKKIKYDLDLINSKVKESQIQVERFEMSKQVLKQKVSYKYEKQSKNARKFNMQLVASEEELEIAKAKDRMKMTESVQQMKTDQSTLEETIKDAVVQRTVTQAEHDLTMATMKEAYIKMQDKLDFHHGRLAKKWGEIKPFFDPAEEQNGRKL